MKKITHIKNHIRYKEVLVFNFFLTQKKSEPMRLETFLKRKFLLLSSRPRKFRIFRQMNISLLWEMNLTSSVPLVATLSQTWLGREKLRMGM